MCITCRIMGILGFALASATTAIGQIAPRPFHAVRGTSSAYYVSSCSDMSLDGTVVADEQTAIVPIEKFGVRWTFETGTRRLPLSPGHVQSEARAISDDGRVIVGNAMKANGTWVPVRWVGDGASEELAGVEIAGGVSVGVLVSQTGRLIAGYSQSATWGVPLRWFVWEEGQETRWVFGKHAGDPSCTLITVRERTNWDGAPLREVEGILHTWNAGTGFILSLDNGAMSLARSPEPLEGNGFRSFIPTCSSYSIMAGVVLENLTPVGSWVWDRRGLVCEPFRFIPPMPDGSVFHPSVIREERDYLMGTLYGIDGSATAAGATLGRPIMPLKDVFIADGIVGVRAAWLASVVAAGSRRIAGGGSAPCVHSSFVWVYVPEDREPFCPDVWNDDGEVTHRDMDSIIYQMQGGWVDPCSDLDHDGRITTSDLRLILQKVGTRCR